MPDYFATKPKNYEPGVTILPVNDPCDDGWTREPNPNEELKMSKNVLETFHIHEEGSYKTIVLQRGDPIRYRMFSAYNGYFRVA